MAVPTFWKFRFGQTHNVWKFWETTLGDFSFGNFRFGQTHLRILSQMKKPQMYLPKSKFPKNRKTRLDGASFIVNMLLYSHRHDQNRSE